MRDTDLYRQLLGLTSPWTVERVELDVKTHRVDVFAVHERPASWPCPECEKACGLHDHDEEKVWRHLDSCGFGTYLHARVPRASCATHGVRQVRVPWAEPKSRFTALFERFAIAVLLETSVAGGDDRLVGSKHLWLYGENNFPHDRYDLDVRMAFAELKTSNLKTARAWALKEMLRSLWKQRSRAAAERWWQRWYGWAVRSRLAPVKKVAGMVKRHLHNVLTYFKHRITNAGSEAINSVVQMLKKRAFGYRSFVNFRIAILFHCGGLDLYPLESGSHPKAG